MELIGIREASRRLGVSDTAVHKAIKSGRVTIEGRTESSQRPLVGWPLVQQQWLASTDESKRNHIGAGAKVTASVKPPPAPKTGRPPITGAKPKADPKPAKLPAAERVPAPAVPPAPPPPPLEQPARDEPPASGRNAPTYAESRAIREAYQARLARLDYEERSGKLVNADQVKADAFKAGRTVRDALLNISGRIAHQLASETDPARISARIDAEIREALKGLVAG